MKTRKKFRCPACESPAPADLDADRMLRCPACHLRFLPPDVTAVTLFRRTGDEPEQPGHSLELTPEFLARFTPEALLGAGGLGSVYLATDRHERKRVAIKFLLRPSPDLTARFRREGEILSRIRHPQIVPVFGTGTVGDIPYLVMEYVRGGTLRARMSQGRLSLEEVLLIARDLLSGLQALHLQGIVHRDIKPENILVVEAGRVKISDLGIAKDYAIADTEVTRTGAIIGTPRYMSPEQVRGRSPVIASDLYAAGLLMYELLAGEYPYDTTSVLKLLKFHEEVKPPPIESRAPGVPPPVATIIGRALAKREGERPQSAEEFLAPILRSLRDLVT